MQINRIQGNFNALSQSNNQTKFSSNPQNTNSRQTTNYLHNYSMPLAFGMFWHPKVSNIDAELGKVIEKFQKKLLKGDYIRDRYKDDPNLGIVDLIMFNPNKAGNKIDNKLKLNYLFEGILDDQILRIEDKTKADELANEILDDVQRLDLKRDFLMTAPKGKCFGRNPVMSALWHSDKTSKLPDRLIDWVEELGIEDQKSVLNMQDDLDRSPLMLGLQTYRRKAVERMFDITKKLGNEDIDFLKGQLMKQATYSAFEPSYREEKGGWTILEYALWKNKPDLANKILDMAEEVGKTDGSFLKEYHSMKMEELQQNHLETAEYYIHNWAIPQQIIERIKTQMAA